MPVIFVLVYWCNVDILLDLDLESNHQSP